MRNRPKFIKHTNTIANPPALTNGAVRGCPSHRQNAWSPLHTFFSGATRQSGQGEGEGYFAGLTPVVKHNGFATP